MPRFCEWDFESVKDLLITYKYLKNRLLSIYIEIPF